MPPEPDPDNPADAPPPVHFGSTPPGNIDSIMQHAPKGDIPISGTAFRAAEASLSNDALGEADEETIAP